MNIRDEHVAQAVEKILSSGWHTAGPNALEHYTALLAILAMMAPGPADAARCRQVSHQFQEEHRYHSDQVKNLPGKRRAILHGMRKFLSTKTGLRKG